MVEELKGRVIEQVSCSKGLKFFETGCIDSEGFVYTWGSGIKGKLGHPERKDQKVPKRIEYLKDVKGKK